MKRWLVFFAALAALVLGAPFGKSAVAQTGQSQAVAADLLFTGPTSPDLRAGVGFGASWLVDFVQRAQQRTFGCDGPTVIMSGNADDIVRGYRGEAYIFVATCRIEFIHVSQLGRLTASQGGAPVAVGRIPDPAAPEHGFSLFPCSLPGGSDLPDAKLTMAFVSPNVAANKTETMTLARDQDKPTLKTTSQPPKGTKVRPGDRITVRIEASEEYRDTRWGWQSGIKKIQLRDESLNRDVVPHYEDTGPMRPCAEKPWKQWLEVTYTVPPNPPPVIRLRATAWDFAGNKDEDVGVFPTGDWYGTLEWSFEGTTEGTPTSVGGNSKRTGRADLVLKQNRRGTVEGTLLGSQTMENLWAYSDMHQYCRFRTRGPNEVSAKLEGAYEETRGHPMFQPSEIVANVEEVLVDSRECTSPPSRSDMSMELSAFLPRLVHKLRRTADGSFAAREEINSVGPRSRLTGQYVLRLRQTSN